MKKLAWILSSAVLISQGALADSKEMRGGLEREQVKLEREMKLEKDKKNHYARLSREDKHFQ